VTEYDPVEPTDTVASVWPFASSSRIVVLTVAEPVR
jgi:hypothetical protein